MRTNRVQIEQTEYELSKMSTSLLKPEDKLTIWVRIDHIDEYDLT